MIDEKIKEFIEMFDRMPNTVTLTDDQLKTFRGYLQEMRTYYNLSEEMVSRYKEYPSGRALGGVRNITSVVWHPNGVFSESRKMARETKSAPDKNHCPIM